MWFNRPSSSADPSVSFPIKSNRERRSVVEHVARSSKVVSGPEIPAQRLYVSHSSRKNAHWDSDDSMSIWGHSGFLTEGLYWCVASGATGVHVLRHDSSVRLRILWLLHHRLYTRSRQLDTWWQAWFYVLGALDIYIFSSKWRCCGTYDDTEQMQFLPCPCLKDV